MLTSLSRKNLTSPISESLIPSAFNIPRSPFSTATKTDLRWSKSFLSKCSAAPKSSRVGDSTKWKRKKNTILLIIYLFTLYFCFMFYKGRILRIVYSHKKFRHAFSTEEMNGVIYIHLHKCIFCLISLNFIMIHFYERSFLKLHPKYRHIMFLLFWSASRFPL